MRIASSIRHTHFYNTIVIGDSLSAKLYAYYNGYPNIYIESAPPFRFDRLSALPEMFNEDTSSLNLWTNLGFFLSMSGLCPMGNKVSTISIRENELRAVTHNSRLGKFEFNKLIIFDDEKITGLPSIEKKEVGLSRVIDWFDVRSGMCHSHSILETSDAFVAKVLFYPADRLGRYGEGKKIKKDLVSISHLTDEELQGFEHSDTMARMKILQLMKDAGIRGRRNGRNTIDPRLYSHYRVKIEHVQREIERDIKNFYEEDPRFEFAHSTPEEIIKEGEKCPSLYAKKIIGRIMRPDIE